MYVWFVCKYKQHKSTYTQRDLQIQYLVRLNREIQSLLAGVIAILMYEGKYGSTIQFINLATF